MCLPSAAAERPRTQRSAGYTARLSSTDSPLDHVTPYDRFAWSDTEIERFLARGERRGELNAYFGAREYRTLAALARRAQRTPLSARCRCS